MGDDEIPLIGDEQAKAIQESAKLGVKALEVVEGAGGWISDILGDVPKNLVGVLGGDRLAEYRRANLEKIAEKAKAKNKARGVTDTERVSLVIALPLFEAAAEESREELQELWARLLATAMDPARSGQVRREFIEIVKKMEPIDALVLMKLSETPTAYTPNPRDTFATMFKRTSDELEVSIAHLTKLDLITSSGAGSQTALTYLGRALTAVLRG